MKNLLACLGLLLAVTTSGCVLYLGEGNEIDGCPPGTFPGTDANGFETCIADDGQWACATDDQCAGGCYCDEDLGECVEAGYCDPNGDGEAQCGFGFECDCSSSCVPAGTATRTCGNSCVETGCPPGQTCGPDGACVPDVPPGCQTDADCATGETCVVATGTCVPVTPPGCQTDADCATGETCDAATGTCVPVTPPGCQTDADCATGETCDAATGVCNPINPPPACNGEITCNQAAPTCPAGQVPLVDDGCWLDICIPLESCGVAPSCEVLNLESQCLANAACNAVYSGVNCTSPDGSACTMGQGNCSCESFNYERCQAD